MIFFPLEVLGAVLVYCIGLEKKEHFKWRFLGAILLITGSISALQVLFQMQKKVAEQAHTLDLGGYIGIYVVITGTLMLLLLLVPNPLASRILIGVIALVIMVIGSAMWTLGVYSFRHHAAARTVAAGTTSQTSLPVTDEAKTVTE